MADICTLEINDCGVSVARNDELLISSPGYALIDGAAIKTGDLAYQQARLHPRSAYNQFWHRLSLDPLTYPTQRFRHQADLAYAHLLQIAESVEDIGDVILAVPSNYTREQLSLLLGIASESPLKVAGLVDASVAAVARHAIASNICYLDLQLHQSVLVSLNVDTLVKRVQFDTLDRAGLSSLYEKWVQLIAHAFIDQCRFDPLHSASTEQALYNQLPRWLTSIEGNEEVVLELESDGKRFDCRLKRDQALQAISPTYHRIAAAIEALRQKYGGELLVSNRFAALPGIDASLPKFTELPANAVAANCAQLSDDICSSGEGLNFVTALPVTGEAPIAPQQTDQPVRQQGTGVTHVLSGVDIYSLHGNLYIGGKAGGSELHIAAAATDLNEPAAQIVKKEDAWYLSPGANVAVMLNGKVLATDTLLQLGDEITTAETSTSLRLVREIADGKKATL